MSLSLTREDLETMSVAERNTLAAKLKQFLSDIHDLNWRDDGRPSKIKNVMEDIDKRGVAILDYYDDEIVSECKKDETLNINKISVNGKISVRLDSDFHYDMETAHFNWFEDSEFTDRFDVDEPDFEDKYRGEDIYWVDEEASYPFFYYAISKAINFADLEINKPVAYYIMDTDNTKNWIYDCTITRLNDAEFQVDTLKNGKRKRQILEFDELQNSNMFYIQSPIIKTV